MEISASLAEDYGEKYILTKNTINKYFNRSGSLPIIARFENKIIGYIIGMPLELLSQEPWARLDENYGKFNTLYTYAFVITAICEVGLIWVALAPGAPAELTEEPCRL